MLDGAGDPQRNVLPAHNNDPGRIFRRRNGGEGNVKPPVPYAVDQGRRRSLFQADTHVGMKPVVLGEPASDRPLEGVADRDRPYDWPLDLGHGVTGPLRGVQCPASFRQERLTRHRQLDPTSRASEQLRADVAFEITNRVRQR